MTDTNQPQPVVVSANEGTKAGLAALGRYAVVIVTALPVLSALIGARDMLGLIAYLQSNEGVAFVAAVVALGTAGYGIFRTRKRGAELATVAADPLVPDTVAQLK